jgi:hypothetical protein
MSRSSVTDTHETGTSTTRYVCVCVCSAVRECGVGGDERSKSQEGDVCVSAHTLHYTTLVSLVSSVVVLLWYHSLFQRGLCGTTLVPLRGCV